MRSKLCARPTRARGTAPLVLARIPFDKPTGKGYIGIVVDGQCSLSIDSWSGTHATYSKGCTMSTTYDITDMIAHPEKYGFSWGYGSLNKAGMELTKTAPYMVHENLERLREVFGDEYFLAIANGTSGRVRDQLLRNDIYENRDLLKQPEELKRIVLERAFGRKPRSARVTVVEKLVEVRTYVADDGTEFTDKGECLAHNIDLKQNA